MKGKKGLFITFEGPDGSGKSTQVRLLGAYLTEQGFDPVLTREPGGTRIGEKIRDIILDQGNAEMDALTESLLYAASRAQHVAEVIRPALDAGCAVLCDRYVDSSIAYQGCGRGLGSIVADINSLAVGGVVPDLTILIDIDPEACFDRIGKRVIREGGDRMESEDLAYHRAVYDGYLELASLHPDRVKRVDGNGGVDAVSDDVRKVVNAFLLDRLNASSGAPARDVPDDPANTRPEQTTVHAAKGERS
ncbi:MAG: dTMP kinase [Clostridiales Family XIII bacterium]|jgi:dTMP kinase|nr:dTMP kinase [Clostridiales Family XIII bacterium]